MGFDLGTRLLLHCASFFALGSPIVDLLIRPLRRSIRSIIYVDVIEGSHIKFMVNSPFTDCTIKTEGPVVTQMVEKSRNAIQGRRLPTGGTCERKGAHWRRVVLVSQGATDCAGL